MSNAQRRHRARELRDQAKALRDTAAGMSMRRDRKLLEQSAHEIDREAAFLEAEAEDILPHPARLFALQDEGTVRFNLPALPFDSTAKPLRVHLDFDADSIDLLIERLVELRKQMKPAPV